MRKLYILFAVLLTALYSSAQVSSYQFSASSGTFTPITGGINIATSTSVADFLGDTKTSVSIPIGFSFTFAGISYSNVIVMSDGFISFNTSATSAAGNNLTSSTAARRPLIAPLWDDLDGNSGSGSAKYITEGTPGSQVFTVEWLNWQWNYAATGTTISFQAKLYEGSNKIEFIYRQESGSLNSASASIGLADVATGSGNFLSLSDATASPTVSSTTETTTINTKPATGQVYTFTVASCFPPTAVAISALTPTSANASWTEPASVPANGYEYELRTSGAPGSGATGLVSSGTAVSGSPSATLSSLTANTTYTLYVRSNCGSGEFSNWSSKSFTTPCNPISTLPWNEGFESVSTVGEGLVPQCFSTEKITGTNWTTANSAVRNSLGARTGTNYIWSRWSSDVWLYTPGFTLTAGTSYDFSFYYRQTDANTGLTITTAFGDNPASASMTNTLGTITDPVNTTYQKATYSFTPSVTGTYYLGIHSVAPTTNPWYFEVDDIQLSVTPSCNEPTAVQVSNITSAGADISWTPPAVGAPVDYQVYVSTSNTAPTAATVPTLTGQNSPATVGSLSANMVYYVWVRSNCGGSDVSSWASGGSFTTPCNPVTTFPWTENFNGVTPPAMTSCFTVINNNNDADKWITYDTYGVGGSNTAGLYTDFNSGSNDDYLVLPGFTLTGNQRFRFSVRARSTTEPNDYRVVLSTTGTNPADFTTVLKPLTTVNSTTHTNIDWIDLSPYTGTVYIAIHVPSGGLDGYYLYVDDMVVENIPTCDVPTAITVGNITTTGAEISWTPPAITSPADYQVYVSTSNTAPTAATVPTLTGQNSPATVGSLSANMVYYVWVRSNCGGSDVSSWASGGSFTTACNAVTTFPWTENFNGVTPPAMASCFTVINNNNDADKWITYDTYGVGGSNTAGLYTDINGGANDDYLVLPGFTLTGNQRFRFSVRARSTTEPNDYRVVLSTTGTNPLDFTTVLKPLTTVNSTTHTNIDWIDLSPYTGTVYIAIHVPSGGLDGYYLYVDDMVVENIPVCDAPTGLTVTNVTATNAQVDWTAPAIGTVTDYSWELRTSGAAGSGTTGLVSSGTTSSTTVNFTTLSASTSYTFYVKTNCVAPNASSFASVSIATVPVNNMCADAIVLNVSSGFCTSATGFTLLGATVTPGLTVGSCGTGAMQNDVWFKVVVPASGAVVVETYPKDSLVYSMNDTKILVYSGTCGSLTEIGCDDDGNTDPGTGSANSRVSISGRTPGEEIYVRVMPYNADDMRDYSICAYDVTAASLPPVSRLTTNSCYAGTPVTINKASNNLFRWVPVYDGSGNIIAEIYSDNQELGVLNSNVYVNSGALRQAGGDYYLDRNVTLTPTTQPATGKVKIRFYIANAELAAYTAVVGSSVTRANLRITKNNDACAATYTNNGAYYLGNLLGSGAYNTTDHYLEDSVSSFSSFFFHIVKAVLPVTLTSLNGEIAGPANRLTWSTSTETNNKGFELQRSADGRNFSALGFVNTKADNGNSTVALNYSFNDNNPLQGNNYYRLKQVDRDGKSTYSNVVLLSRKVKDITLSSVYPNPTTKEINLVITSPRAEKLTIIITDLTGKVVKQQPMSVVVGENQQVFNVQQLAQGTYLIKAVCANGCETAVHLFVKQ